MRIVFCLVIVLAMCAAVCARLTQPKLENLMPGVSLDFDEYISEKSTTNNLNHYQITGKYENGRDYSAFVATFSPQYFTFYPPTPDGCTKLVQPSQSSADPAFDCEYATNGAFFTWDTSKPSLCIGNLVSDGRVWQLPTDGSGNGRANFGITAEGNLLTGFVDATLTSSRNLTTLITGWGWLVRNGESYIRQSADMNSTSTFATEKAPRTAVGHFKNGTMILLEIDGEEDINAGPDLFETAELLVKLGVESAVNIDGGGSSVSVLNGRVVSQPTCNDTPVICERADASIACVKRHL